MRPTVSGTNLRKTRTQALIVVVFLLLFPFARMGEAQSKVEQAVVEKARSLESRGLTDLAAQTWQQVLLSDPDNAEALAGLARAAKKQGNDAEAARVLGRLRQLNPNDPQIAVIESTVSDKVRSARQGQAEALAAAHNYAGAMQIYRQIYGEHPPDDVAPEYYETEAATETGKAHAISGLRELARRHPGDGRYQTTLGRVLSYSPKTRAEGEAILQQWPQDAGAQSALRQALLWDGQNPQAAGAIKRYLQDHPDAELGRQLQATESRQTQPSNPLAASPVEQAAYRALEANEVDRAEQEFRELLDQAPSNSRALAGLGFVHMKQGNFDLAVSDFEAAQKNGLKDRTVETALGTARFWRTMGEADKALKENQLDLATQRYREALTQSPARPEALAGLAGTLLRSRQATEAALVYARWVKAQANSAPAWRGLFAAQVQAGQPQQAIATSKRFPGPIARTLAADPEYLMDLAAAYKAAGDAAKSAETLERALNLPFPEDGSKIASTVRMQYAAVLAATGRHQQAAGLYRQVIAEEPDNSAAWQGLILARHLMHDDAGAVDAVERMPLAAYETSARDPGFLSMIAAAYQQQGRGAEAQRLLEDAEALLVQQGIKPSADLKMQIAGIEQQRKHPRAAAVLYRQVLETDPQRADAWSGLLSTLHQSADDAQALTEMAAMPAQVQNELLTNDDYLLTLSAVYSATGHSRWALGALSRLRARYAGQHIPPPADVEIQISWLLLHFADEGDLYSTLMRLGGRNDLTDGQRKQVQTIWAAWSVSRAAQAAGVGNTRRSLMILNTAKEALAGNGEVSRALAGGYLAAGDAPTALTIYQSIDLRAAADYQGAIGAALAAKNFKLAESWLRLALELYPHDASILGLAARFEQARGDHGKALEYWKASLERSPDTGAADRLADTLRTPVAGVRGKLPAGDALAALLGSPTGEARPAIRLPGESETATADIPGTGTIAAAEPAPETPSASDPAVSGRGEKLSDYRPQAESPLAGQATPYSDDAGMAGAPGLSQTHVDAATDDRRRHLLVRKPAARDANGPLSQVGPSEVVAPLIPVEPLQAAAEALAAAANQPTSAPEILGRPIADRPIAERPIAKRPMAERPMAEKSSAAGSDAAAPHQGPGERLTIRYASTRQAGAPETETVTSQQEVQPGLTDQQLVDSHLPPLSRSYVPAQPRQALSSRQEALQQIAAIDGGFSPWVGGTGDVHHRSGTPGFDQLTTLEAPFEASTPMGLAARLTVITTPVFLDAGVATGTSTLNFGSLPSGTIPPQQYADGVASELQLTAVNFAARAGETPYGFLVTNITGGVRWRPVGGPLTFTFSREAVKDTQLSYSGLRDPSSATAAFDGNIWGGVMSNTGDVQVAHGDSLSGFYAGLGGEYITGQHVLTNTQFHGNAGAYWRVLSLPDLGTLVLGANFFGMHYAHNLRYFTYGQGGYFSPEAYFLAAMPVSWTGHYGANLHYNVTGSIGAQSFQEDSAPYYPLDARLQSALGDPLVPVRSSVGSNYDLQSELAYRVQDHWYLGGFLDFNNTRDYESQSVGFFVRYLFRPQPDSENGPIGAFPRDGFRPVTVP